MSITKIKTLVVLLLASSGLMLTSCSSSDSDWAYPSNKTENVVSGDNLPSDLSYNDFETFYDSITSGTTMYSRAVNEILYRIAKDEVDFDGGFLSQEFLQKKIDEALLAEVSGGTYDTNYKFDENRLVRSLESRMYTIGNKDKAKSGFVITPDMKVSDILGCDYTDYIERAIKPGIYRQALVAKYIYNERYSTIGSTYARKVKVVSITDRSDKKGSAVNTIQAFIDTYIASADATDEQRDLSNLARIWIGTNLTTEDEAFIAENGLVTLKDQITDEVAKIDLQNPRLSDKSLESKYTNSYTYSVEKGERLAIDSLSRTDLVQDGYFLRSNGLSSLPDSVKNRVFSTNYNLDANSSSKDVTLTVNNHRYVTPSITLNSDNLFDSIVHYDSSSSTYYIVEVFDVINSSALKVNDSDSDEVKADKKARAEEIAYELADGSSLTTDSTIYWLKNKNITYTNNDFYDYVKETYPDVFEDD